LARTEGVSPFNLALDDNILTKYYLTKINIKNNGGSIAHPLKFTVSFQDDLVKIVDVKHKLISPKNKSFPIAHNIPHLNWSVEGGNLYLFLQSMIDQRKRQ
jgi:hypothetical protein